MSLLLRPELAHKHYIKTWLASHSGRCLIWGLEPRHLSEEAAVGYATFLQIISGYVCDTASYFTGSHAD